MRVLQLIQRPQLRGAENFACQLATELMTIGAEVDVAYLFSGVDSLVSRYPALNFIPVGGQIKKRLFDLKGYRSLSRIIEGGNYDLIQANAADTLKYAIFSKLLFRWSAPVVFRNANQMSSFLTRGFQRFFNKSLLRLVDYVISVSENCRVDIVGICPSLEAKSKTIPIGTYDFDHLPGDPRKEAGPVLANVGSFVQEKNHWFLLLVFKEFYAVNNNARLWLIGDGPLRGELELQASNLGLSGVVVFFGYREDAVNILKSADILVLPSLIEGLPGVILEAFSCGVPVLSSRVGGIPEVVIDGVTGICLADWSVDAYVDGIKRLLETGLRQQIIEQARAFVKSKYRMDVVTTEFLDTYKEILKSKRR